MKEWIQNNKALSVAILLIMILILVYIFSGDSKASNGSDRTLAQCLKDSGAKFYGASWCGHCKNQKAMFGDDAINLPYIECDENRQKCAAANVTSYPTWVFANGKRQSGEVSLAQLKQLAGC